MKIKITEMEKILRRSLTKRGLSVKEAKIVAREYLMGELEGKITHGLMAFPALLEANKFFHNNSPRIIKKTPATVFINGNGNVGVLVVDFILKKVIKDIKKSGSVLLAINNISPVLRPGSIAETLAAKNLIGLVFENGGKEMMAPEGGIDPILATNPIGIGIPTAGDSIVVDMATSKRAWGEIRLAKRFKHKLLDNTYLDKKGYFTNNPDKVHSVVPMAGYKGFSLALAIEILTGSLVQSSMGIRRNVPGTYQAATRGLVILVINPAFFGSATGFKRKNSLLIKQIKQSRKAKGFQEILIPGERAKRKLLASQKEGKLEIEKDLYEKLLSFS